MISFSSISSPVYLLGGLTGSGKTELLHHLRNVGQQVVNLEELCCHDGSAFARLKHASQPSSYQFHKTLKKYWQSLDSAGPVFIEQELKRIGNLTLPGWLWERMVSAPVIWLDTEKSIRLERLSKQIRASDPLLFCDCLQKLSARLGEGTVKAITTMFAAGNVEGTVEGLLHYYDHCEGYALPDNNRIIFTLPVPTLDMKAPCEAILQELVLRTFNQRICG
ncbi:MAG: hypothetical protein KF746_20615 [Chitinophagaceae bacterium]|nr:hypothetical protein [Chitinophagaceae bacterium]